MKRDTQSKDDDLSDDETHSIKNRLYDQTKNQHNIPDITDITVDNYRSQGSIWCNKALLTAYRNYTKSIYHMSMADCLERALLNDMRTHPVATMNLTINHVTEEKLTEIQKRLEIAIMYSEIKHLVEILDRIKATGRGNYEEFQYDLLKALKPAVKLRNPSPKLIELLAEAEKHVDTI